MIYEQFTSEEIYLASKYEAETKEKLINELVTSFDKLNDDVLMIVVPLIEKISSLNETDFKLLESKMKKIKTEG